MGLNSVFWGRGCVVYSAAVYTFDMAFPKSTEYHPAWRLVPGVIMILIYLVLYTSFGNKRPKIGDVITANEQRYTWRFTRRVMLFFTPAEAAISVIGHKPSSGLVYILALYFLAVDDLPSQPSKLRLWLESLMSKPLPNGASARINH